MRAVAARPVQVCDPHTRSALLSTHDLNHVLPNLGVQYAGNIAVLRVCSDMPEPTPPRATMQSRSVTPAPIQSEPTRALVSHGPRGRRPSPAAPSRSATPRDEREASCEVQVVHLEQVARARAALPGTGALDAPAALLRAMGDRTRLQIVVALAAADELCVCDLAAVVRVSQSAVSHSLRTLRQLGVVGYRKDAQIAYYTIDARWRASPLGELIVAGTLWPGVDAGAPPRARRATSRSRLDAEGAA